MASWEVRQSHQFPSGPVFMLTGFSGGGLAGGLGGGLGSGLGGGLGGLLSPVTGILGGLGGLGGKAGLGVNLVVRLVSSIKG